MRRVGFSYAASFAEVSCWPFFQKRPRCLIGMEACAGSHDWGRRLQEMGHDVRLMPPSYVKPYVKRGKTDAAAAAAICEAVTRPSMRFAAIKSEACSSILVLHRTRDFLVRQRTQIGNAIRAHMTEFGVIAAKGAQNVDRLKEHVDLLPEAARTPVNLLFDQLAETDMRVEQLTCMIEETHEQNETSQRLATIPGVGMLSATIIAATVTRTTRAKYCTYASGDRACDLGSARLHGAWQYKVGCPDQLRGSSQIRGMLR
jgi:transposase